MAIATEHRARWGLTPRAVEAKSTARGPGDIPWLSLDEQDVVTPASWCYWPRRKSKLVMTKQLPTRLRIKWHLWGPYSGLDTVTALSHLLACS